MSNAEKGHHCCSQCWTQGWKDAMGEKEGHKHVIASFYKGAREAEVAIQCEGPGILRRWEGIVKEVPR